MNTRLMTTPILTTKLYVPSPRSDLVPRSGLIRQLNDGLSGKLTLISATAGFGKSTLLSEILQIKIDPAGTGNFGNHRSTGGISRNLVGPVRSKCTLYCFPAKPAI